MAKRKKSLESVESTVTQPSATASDSSNAGAVSRSAVLDTPAPELSDKPVTGDALPVDDGLRARIASRAYELFEARGTGGGDEVQDWLDAEREIHAAERGVKAE